MSLLKKGIRVKGITDMTRFVREYENERDVMTLADEFEILCSLDIDINYKPFNVNYGSRCSRDDNKSKQIASIIKSFIKDPDKNFKPEYYEEVLDNMPETDSWEEDGGELVVVTPDEILCTYTMAELIAIALPVIGFKHTVGFANMEAVTKDGR